MADSFEAAISEDLRREVRERQRAEMQARRGVEQLRFVTDHVPVLIVYCDTEERYRFVNSSCSERFGLPSDQIIGKRIVEVVGPAAYETLRNYIQAALSGERVEFELRVPYERIGAHWMHFIYAPQT